MKPKERQRDRENFTRVGAAVAGYQRDGVTWPSRCCVRHCERPVRWVQRGGGGARRVARDDDDGDGGYCCDGQHCWHWLRHCWHCRPAAVGCFSCSSSVDFETISWLDVPSNSNCAPIPSVSVSKRRHWTGTLSLVQVSGISNKVSASCAPSPGPSIPADSVPENLRTDQKLNINFTDFNISLSFCFLRKQNKTNDLVRTASSQNY